MGLTGQLDDLPLLDMLQIIAFSKRSGYLRVTGAPGRGAVLLKEGRVLFSYSWSTVAKLRSLAAEPSSATPELIRECIEASLRDLGSLREGSFEFDLSDSIDADWAYWGRLRVKPLLLEQGLDPQELLLDLAVELDDERRAAASPSPLELACRVTANEDVQGVTTTSAASDASSLLDVEPDGTEMTAAAATAAAAAAAAAAADDAHAEYLTAMTRKLFEPRGTRDVSGLVLDVAQRFIERGILFVVKGNVAKGIAGYGIARHSRDCSTLARRAALDLETCQPVSEVVRTGRPVSVTAELEGLAQPLYSVFARGSANVGVFLPVLYNGATLLFLFGDNGVTGAPLGDLSRLELFLGQAGMALENKYLQQRLRSRFTPPE